MARIHEAYEVKNVRIGKVDSVTHQGENKWPNWKMGKRSEQIPHQRNTPGKYACENHVVGELETIDTSTPLLEWRSGRLTNAGKDVEQQKLSFISGNGSAILKDSLAVSLKIKYTLTIQSSNLCSLVFTQSQGKGTSIPKPAHRFYRGNGILLSLEKKWVLTPRKDREKSQVHVTTLKKSIWRGTYCMSPTIIRSKKRRTTETAVVQGWR